MNKLSYLSLMLMLVSACSQESAAIVDQGSKFFGMVKNTLVPGQSAPPPVAAVPVPITVQEGDTLLKLAARHGKLKKDIIALNNLTPPYRLQTGMTLLLPTQKYHHVAPKETLSKVARLYSISVPELITSNQLATPYKIKIGQLLRIPDHNAPSFRAGSMASMTPESPAPMMATPTVYSVPIVSKKIAQFAGSADKPLRPLPISANESMVPPSTPFYAPTPQPASSTPAVQSLPLTPLPKTRVRQHSATENTPSQYDIPVSTDSTGKFSWPVKGTVVSRFGPRKGGLYNDGINIASPENTPIRAAADGSVVYAGNELHGYGNLTIMKHDSGMITAYAHQRDILVKKGERIRRGQVIGHVGATGNVSSPQLHFGIREGDKAVDPELYLSGK